MLLSCKGESRVGGLPKRLIMAITQENPDGYSPGADFDGRGTRPDHNDGKAPLVGRSHNIELPSPRILESHNFNILPPGITLRAVGRQAVPQRFVN